MKKVMWFAVMFTLAISSALAQSSNLKKFFEEQKEKEGITRININGNLQFTDPDSHTDIRGMKMLTFDTDESGINCKDFMTEANKALDADGYIQVMSMDHENEKMDIYLLNDENGNNAGAAFTVVDEDRAVITWVDGKIDLSDMTNMMGDFNMDVSLDSFDIEE